MSKFSSNIRKSATSKLATTFVMCSALGYAISTAGDYGSDDADRYRLILNRFVTATKQCVKFVPSPGDEEYIQKAVKLFEDVF